MQGEFGEEAQPPTMMVDRIVHLYKNRAPASELLSVSFGSVPTSIDACAGKIKSAGPRFMFYYMVLLAAINVFFLFACRLFIIPIAITLTAAALGSGQMRLGSDIEVTPTTAAIGCAAAHLIFCLLFRSMIHCYISVIVLNILGLFLLVTHCVLTVPKDDEDENV
ncbi:hypothetical protein PAPHI01_0479 [Pancytospora philotis]|nr:hypothetical protein PAPHI01_0479 [Pancytospora philotis]